MSEDAEARVSALYRALRTAVLATQNELDRVEAGRAGGGEWRADEARADSERVLKEVARLEELCRALPASRLTQWRRKVEPLRQQAVDVQARVLSVARRREQALREDSERRELFGGTGRSAEAEAEAGVLIEKMDSSTVRSQRAAAEMLELGSNTLSEMVGQREVLKRAQRRLLDMASSLGVSRTFIKMIEKREFSDKRLVYSGMAMITVLIFFIWYFLS